MKPILEKVPLLSTQSFAVKEEIVPAITIGWHFHGELELTLFTEGSGKWFIGDHTNNFGPGDLILIGSNLPHYMRNEASYYEQHSDLNVRAIVIHFTKDFLGKDFMNVPEMLRINKLLEQSQRGIQIEGSTRAQVDKKMEHLLSLKGFERMACLLDILHDISDSTDKKYLASIGYQYHFTRGDAEKINAVYEYILKHMTKQFTLSDVSNHVHMSPSAFCKFMKRKTGKTFSYVVNEIRIGHACKLLIEEPYTISQICYASGFNNMSYFNRKFKAFTNYSALAYRKRFHIGS